MARRRRMTHPLARPSPGYRLLEERAVSGNAPGLLAPDVRQAVNNES
jgi:hypothetical protein